MKKDDFLLGIVDWMEKNIVSVFPSHSVSRFMAYAALPVVRDKASRMLEENRAMLEEQGIMLDDDIDVAAVADILVPAMKKAEAVDFVFLGMKFSIKPQNIEAIISSLMELNIV